MSSPAPIERTPIHLYIPGNAPRGQLWRTGDAAIDALWTDAGNGSGTRRVHAQHGLAACSLPTVLRLHTRADVDVAAGSVPAGVAVETADVRLLIEHGAPDSLKRTPLYLLSRPPAATDIAESLDDIAHSVDNLRKAGFENLFCCLAVTQCVELHGAYSFLKRELGIGTVAALSPGGEGLHTLVRGALHIGSLFYDALADVVLLMPGKKGTLSRHDITGLLQIAKGALSPLGRYPASYTLVSCPMCGRCEIDITGMTQDVDRLLSSTEKEYRDRGISLAALGGISVAVMGCNVNGPGEARGADIGIAGGRAGSGTIFLKGSVYETLPEAALLPRFKTLLHTLIDEKANAT